jgi:hypothetical protein
MYKIHYLFSKNHSFYFIKEPVNKLFERSTPYLPQFNIKYKLKTSNKITNK